MTRGLSVTRKVSIAFCHVERSRDISDYCQRDSGYYVVSHAEVAARNRVRFLDSARNDKGGVAPPVNARRSESAATATVPARRLVVSARACDTHSGLRRGLAESA